MRKMLTLTEDLKKKIAMNAFASYKPESTFFRIFDISKLNN